MDSCRTLIGILSVAEQLNLLGQDATILAYNGGQLVSTKDLGVLWQKTVDVQTIHTCFAYAKTQNLAALSYDENGVITEMPDDRHVHIEAYNNAIPIRKVDSLIKEVQTPRPKIMIVGEPSRLIEAREELLEAVGDVADIGFSEPFFMEITAKGVQKASSLLELLRLRKESQEQLMVIGDGLNDVPMFSVAGLAVAMENSSDEVKSYAHVMTSDNNNDGVALAIDRHILSK